MKTYQRFCILVMLILLPVLVLTAVFVPLATATSVPEQAFLEGVAHLLPSNAIAVTTLEDELNGDGDCSLREALAAANDNVATDACAGGDAVLTDTITFSVTGTILLTDQLTVTAGGPVLIEGRHVITVSGNNNVRVLTVDNGSRLTLANITLADGYTQNSDGAGIYNDGGFVEVHDCTIRDNAADFFGGGGGGISNYGTMSIHASTLSGNSVFDGSGGGIFNDGDLTIIDAALVNNQANFESGAGIWNQGTLVMENTVLSGNMASLNGGGIVNNGIASLTNSTLHGNFGGDGGAISNYGGAIFTITHSTCSSNSAMFGGCMVNGGRLLLDNSTVSGNTADEGGAIHNTGALQSQHMSIVNNSAQMSGGGILNGGTVTMTSSIIAGNSVEDCNGSIISQGYNLAGDNTCSLTGPGDLNNIDPLLGPLQDNGGSTLTHLPDDGSPVIDVGEILNCPATDQRGIMRPQDGDGDGNAICDIGSVEYQILVTITSVTIAGPLAGYVQSAHSFTATVVPISATQPIDYVWEVASQEPMTHTGGISDTAVFSWTLPGAYALTVIASNGFSSVTDTHAITISDVPITGLAVTNSGPVPVDEIVTFTATISAGTNVSYTWNFGDDSFATGQVVTHIYTLPNIYTATVTASNSIGMVNATTTVTILEPQYFLYLPMAIKP